MPPSRVGNYEVIERIGKGGMAEVFRARYRGAAGAQREVVIKRMLPFADEEKGTIQELFVTEARLTLQLTHGNIVQVFEFGEEDDQYYLVMELVDGLSLGQLLAQLKRKGLPTLPPALAALVVLLVASLVGTAIGIWNRSFLQGRTGQSVGKRVVGIRLVAEATLAPPGPAQAFLRDLCHVLDAYSYVGYLWPLWDARRRTFADMVMRTLVVDAPPGAGRGGGPQSVPGGAPEG